ncbi:MAG: type II toxin-antitoxin system VapC family toxin [Thermoanaerobaculaceae bacterium]
MERRGRSPLLFEGGGRSQRYISEVSLGEVYYRLGRIKGLAQAETFWWEALSGSLPLTTVPATTPRIRAAARIKAQHLVSYTDAFVIGTALELGAPVVTGDPEILCAREALGIEVIELE